MAVLFKCKMCGADLNVVEGQTVCTCESCETMQTVPAMDNEEKINLFKRANDARFRCDYEAAANLYNGIVAKFPKEAEAYWGLCLCKYGIEYVEDRDGERMPTCHRTSYDKIFNDPDYKKALENADISAKSIYKSEAKKIDRLQEGILKIVENENSYDIFICYKETDDKGGSTEDSVLAQDIYNTLTAEGYKVFFSRVTLEDKLGIEYEPYIFSALYTAKVMLVVGTKTEYINAVWVKNEWSRFFSLMKNDKNKHLYPCYKYISPTELPTEMTMLQGKDIGEIGAVQDLLRNIAKVIPLKKESMQRAYGLSVNVESLLERVFDEYLIGCHWDKALETCDRVLDSDPKNSRAFLGKLMAQLEIAEEKNLAYSNIDFEQYEYFQKAVEYSQPEYLGKLMNYLHSSLYYLGKNSFNENDFLTAHDFFKRSDYKNSKEMQQQCINELDHIKNIRDTFTKIFLRYDIDSNNIKHSQETEVYIKKQKDLDKKYPYGVDSPTKIIILFFPTAIAEILSGLVVIFFQLFSDKITAASWEKMFKDGLVDSLSNFPFNGDVLKPICVFFAIAFLLSFVGFLAASGFSKYKLIFGVLLYPYAFLFMYPGLILTRLFYPYGCATFIIFGILLLIAPIHRLRKYKKFNILEDEISILCKKKDDALNAEIKKFCENCIVQYPNISNKTINNCLNEIQYNFKPRILNTKKINEL